MPESRMGKLSSWIFDGERASLEFETLGMKIWAVSMSIGVVNSVDDLYPGKPHLRDLIPEPFDIFDHIGSVPGPMVAGAAATALAANRLPRLKVSETYYRAAGLLGGAVMTAAAELFPGATADPLDVAYGLLAGVVGMLSVEPKENF